ncbi:MAG: hotdog domain-containing protein [Myxococcota bacterium]
MLMTSKAPNTHLSIDRTLCGEPETLSPGAATVRFVPTPAMVADAQGLVHGGFVFGAVDYAAMLAVNDPNVVLGSADVRFVAPVKLGDEVRAVAELQEEKGKKRVLSVRASVGDREVLTGTMVAFVLDQHVLS